MMSYSLFFGILSLIGSTANVPVSQIAEVKENLRARLRERPVCASLR